MAGRARTETKEILNRLIDSRHVVVRRESPWLLALASSIYIAETCAPFTGLGP